MNPFITISLATLLLGVFYSLSARSVRSDADRVEEDFDGFLEDTNPRFARVARVATPALRSRAVAELSMSPALRGIRTKVQASGMFAGSVDIYLAFQATGVALGAALELLALSGPLSGMQRLLLAIMGVACAIGPYASMSERASKVAAEVERSLPFFVEVLSVALASGMSVQQALGFSVRQSDDTPVARAAAWLVATLESGSMSERDAYEEAGRRLGSPEAMAFFSALGQAASQGTSVAGILKRQSDALRVQTHQRRRAAIKKIPVQLVIIFAVHLLPLLFVSTLFPVISSFGDI